MADQTPDTSAAPWSVSYLNEMIASRFQGLASVLVEGEITNWNLRGGHVYGTLRDVQEDAKINFTIWRNSVAQLTGRFKEGDRVTLYGVPSFWVAGGSLSFNATRVSHVGIGDFLERLEQLRRKLQAEGLFNQEHKKRLPFLPVCIGLITGRDSDAEKDVKTNVLLRYPNANIKTEYTLVQGERAASEVAAAIAKMDSDPEVDVIIVARGGGELMHLLPFSDEQVVRAAFAAQTPLISAIGHEADRPLLDDVADLRASTPTDAAKRVVPDIAEEKIRVGECLFQLRNRIAQTINVEFDKIQNIRDRTVFSQPEKMFERQEEDIARYRIRLSEMLERNIENSQHSVDKHLQALRALSPLQTLARGYAIVQDRFGTVTQDPAVLQADDSITITLQKGTVQAKVTKTKTSN